MAKSSNQINGSTERVQKLRKRHFEIEPSICIDRDLMFTRVMKETEGERNEIRCAKAIKHIMENIGTPIEADELIVGASQSRVKSVALYPELGAKWVIDALDEFSTRQQDPLQITEEDKRIMREEIYPYWETRSLKFKSMKQLGPEAQMLIDMGQYLAIWGEQSAGHFQPDFAWVLSKGFESIKKDAEDKLETLTPLYYENLRHIDFLKALILVCDGILAYGRNYAKKARELAAQETNPDRKKELEVIAEVCDQVPAKPARTFREAVQFVYFIQALCYTESNNQACAVLRFDQYAYPYYKADVESGRLTKAQTKELVECLWLKLDEILQLYSNDSAMFYPGYMPFQVLSLGGLNADGSDAANELTYLCLEVTRDMRLRQPSVVAVFHDKSTDEFYHACVECLKAGTGGMPAFINADMGKIGISGIRPHQASVEEAVAGSGVGCVSYCVPGTASGVDCGVCNMGQDFEKMLNNGFVKMVRMQVGPKTGDPRTFKTFDEVMEAFKGQMKFTIKRLAEAVYVFWRCHEEDLPQHLESLLQPYPIQKAERAISPYNSGTKYPTGGSILPIGMATVSNSLAVIKKFIYDEKTLTWDTLLDALDKNYEGYEDLRQMLVNKAPKYGNDDDYVDSIAKEIHDFLFEYMMGTECDPMRNEFLSPNFMAINSHVPMGFLVGATPDGRLAYTPLSDNLSPVNGTEKNGAPGVLNTILKYKPEYQLQTLLNLRFTRDSIEGENEKKWVDLMRAYFKKGGYHAQFNFVESQTLREAQEKPEDYRDLMVRVAGFSAYFTQLAKISQDNLISRAEHQIS